MIDVFAKPNEGRVKVLGTPLIMCKEITHITGIIRITDVIVHALFSFLRASS